MFGVERGFSSIKIRTTEIKLEFRDLFCQNRNLGIVVPFQGQTLKQIGYFSFHNCFKDVNVSFLQ